MIATILLSIALISLSIAQILQHSDHNKLEKRTNRLEKVAEEFEAMKKTIQTFGK